MGIFEGFFGGKQPEKEKPAGIPAAEVSGKPRLDAMDIEANGVAKGVERDAMRLKMITKNVIDNVEKLIMNYPDVFSYQMSLEDFISILKERMDEAEIFKYTEQNLDHLIALDAEDFDINGNLEKFMKTLRYKNNRSD